MTLEAVARAKVAGAGFVHVALRGVEDAEAIEHYVQHCVDRQARKNSEVVWYEVVLQGNGRRRLRRQYSARVTAHLRDRDVLVAAKGDDQFFAVRDVFDALAQRLDRTADGSR